MRRIHLCIEMRAILGVMLGCFSPMSAPTAKLSFEIAQLRRLKFGKKSEQLDAEQRALFDEALDADLAAAEAQLQELLGKKKPPATPGAMPKRTALPADLPRVDCHHEPRTLAARAAVRSSASAKLDNTPGVFTVECHIRGKWTCAQVPNADPGASPGGDHRQGHPHLRAAHVGAGRKGLRPSAAYMVVPRETLQSDRHAA